MSASSVSAVTERALIDRVRQRLQPAPPFVIVGIGDDAAAVRPDRGALDVLTTDALVEHVHFRRDWTAPRAIGRKALAVNLSDLAAMGATPRVALLGLILPPDLPLADFDAIVDGAAALARDTRTAIVGGNISRSPGPLVIDVTAMGAVRPRHVLTRGGGRAGDELYVTGTVGGAAAGLALLQAGAARAGLDDAQQTALARYEDPVPRLRFGQLAGRTRAASAAMDLSDGLADAARQIADASGTGVVIDADAVPIDPAARAWAAERGLDPVALAVRGGEDYELLLAVPARRRGRFLTACRRESTLPVTKIGRLTTEPGAWLERAGRREPLPSGFVHF